MDYENSLIVYAATPGKAKQKAIGYLGDEWIYLRTNRAKYLDRFEGKEIPSFWLAGGSSAFTAAEKLTLTSCSITG